MITKENAASKATRGTLLALILSLTLRTPTAQNGSTSANMTEDVTGLRYPSGICMAVVLIQISKAEK
jgi:hypothetical protein